VLNDMVTIDPMYQFALDAYSELYSLSIEKSQRSPKLEERINNLNEYHTYAVYRYFAPPSARNIICCLGLLIIDHFIIRPHRSYSGLLLVAWSVVYWPGL